MPNTLLFALAFVVSVAALGGGVFAVYQARWLLAAAGRRQDARLTEIEAALESVRAEVVEYERQLRDMEGQAAVRQGVIAPANGLNLSRRSQALRMHRYGQSTSEIAGALGVPFQEVDLLLKVHRIVISQS